MRNSILSPIIVSAVILASFTLAHAGQDCGSDTNWDAAKLWFTFHKAAWERRNAEAAASMFSSDAEYDEDPFDRHLRGRAEILRYWEEAARSQRDISVNFELLAAAKGMGIVRWHASFTRVPSGQHVELDGIAQFFLDSHGQCTRFLEWWHRKQAP